MRMTKFLAKTTKETPRDAELPSHRFMLRGGFIRQYSAGIYGLLPLGARSIAKIEAICREEMNRIDGLEIKMPCVATKELWEETGRYHTFGKDMMRLRDRHDKDFVLNPTHEEPVVFLARNEVTSYKQLPLMLYQVQTKFRDEPRPRGGLIRLREFTMKDAYSFHESEDDLKTYYNVVHESYMRFYKRTGCKNFVSVLSDNGLFGGKFSHEFQMLAPTGEDTLFTCSQCRYSANREIARTTFAALAEAPKALEKKATPGQKSIESLCEFLKISPEKTAKAVMFQTAKKELIITFIRGDLNVIDLKVRTAIQSDVIAATQEVLQNAGAVAGSTGPIGLDLTKATVVIDNSLIENANLATGANEDGVHYIHFNFERDFLSTLKPFEKNKVIIADIAAAAAGNPCPDCGDSQGGVLQEKRGIEIGNIFHLGKRYSEGMNCSYLDREAKKQYPIMGCYGIGITRLLAAIIEESHDERGPILPLPIAPFEVQLCVLNRGETNVLEKSEELYKKLLSAGVEVLLDDRDEKPGSQFADADLFGIPFRLIISPKTLQENAVELKYRDQRAPVELIKLDQIVLTLKKLIQTEYDKYNNVQ